MIFGDLLTSGAGEIVGEVVLVWSIHSIGKVGLTVLLVVGL